MKKHRRELSIILVITQMLTFCSYASEVPEEKKEKIDFVKRREDRKERNERESKGERPRERMNAKWISVEDEIQYGHFVDAQILNRYIVLEDAPIVDFIANLGREISTVSARPELPYTFKVLNSPEANAFAGPGGYIYITTGLLDILDTKDQVASILAHEIAHVCERHALLSLQNAQNAQVVGTTLAVAAVVAIAVVAANDSGGYSPQYEDLASVAGQAAFMTAVIVNKGYSREYERDADKMGLKYLMKAGYNPKGSMEALERLREYGKREGHNQTFSLLNTHPPVDDRIKMIDRIVHGMSVNEKEG